MGRCRALFSGFLLRRGALVLALIALGACLSLESEAQQRRGQRASGQRAGQGVPGQNRPPRRRRPPVDAPEDDGGSGVGRETEGENAVRPGGREAARGLVIRPPEPWDARVSPAGPWLDLRRVYLLGNAGSEELAWSAEATVDWLCIEPPQGTIARGERVTVFVDVVQEAVRYLPPGAHPAVVYFANASGAGSAPREITLRVKPTPGPPVVPLDPFEVVLNEDLSDEVVLGANDEQGSRAGGRGERVYVLSNPVARDLSFQVRSDTPWLSVHPTEGMIAPADHALVRVRVLEAEARTALYAQESALEGRVVFERIPESGVHAQDQHTELPSTERLVRVRRAQGEGGLVVEASNGELSGPDRGTWSVRNRGSSALAWEGEVLGSELLVTPESGTLEPGEACRLELRVRPSAAGEAQPGPGESERGVDDDGRAERARRAEERRLERTRDRDPLAVPGAFGVALRDTSGSTAAPVVWLAPPAAGEDIPRTSSVTRFGLTWRFDRSVPTGVFANGDPWVVGPVAVVGIEPRTRTLGPRTMNGSMVNPSARHQVQAYDSAMFGPYREPGSYRERLNVGRGLTPADPLLLAPHSSLVSTVSVPTGGARPQLDTAAILTVLEEPAPAGSFRPAYCGRDKTPRFSVDQLDVSLLRELQPTPSAPAIRQVASWFERPWLDHVPDWIGRYNHPAQNMPDYGREMCDQVGTAALMLHLDLPLAEKRPLLVRYVQLGIDLFGIVEAGGTNTWPAGGGHHSGRKWPILFAGLMLGDPGMLAIGERDDVAFNEDDQTFYVEETSPGVYNNGHGGYGPEHVGLPEWGNQHAKNLAQDDVRWSNSDGTNKHLDYRTCCTANVWWGQLLAAHVMGAQGLWGHDALFDYQDRYRRVVRGSGQPGWTISWSPFMLEMWDRYRKDYR